jgi:Flp pilus assembly protein TadD
MYMQRFQEVEKRNQLSDRVQSLNNFALEAARDNNWTQAVEQLHEALHVCGACWQLPVLHRNLGLTYARTGDIESALRELHVALKLNPNDSDASKAIEILESLKKKQP